jgi:hypothetical protein
MHLQNAGQDNKTSAAATLQVRFGTGPLINKPSRYIQLNVLIYHLHRAGPATNPTHFANADRYLQAYWSRYK